MLVTLGTLAGASLASAGAASASDLIVLGPDSVTLAGTVTYDHVYIGDGATLRLSGDTTIVASDVYLAAGSSLRSCFVPPNNDNGCNIGRNLAIQSSGQINIGSGVSLTANSGTVRPGGSLALSGSSITVSGGIDTSGSQGGGSGYVSISSPGAIALSSPYYAASVNAPGGAVSIHGASIGVSGDINTEGSDAAIVTAGGIDIAATNGAVRIGGNVNAYGRDNSGGSGADVSIRGTDVRVGRIDASAGSSNAGPPGYAGNVGVAGSASVTVTDYIDTRGSSGPTTFGATGGGNVALSSGGPILAGTIYASGANADAAFPSGAGSIVISGGAVAVGQLFTNGGNRSNGAGYGATANGVSITSAGALTVGNIEAFGGNSNGNGVPGGHGGQITLTGDGIFTGELRTTPGNSSGNSPGGSGGPIVVNGRSSVMLSGGVFTGGANASGGGTNPAAAGGSGGPVTLHAVSGLLALSGAIQTGGGNGGNAPTGVKAGPGGAGGAVELVGTPIDPILGISTDGGDGGFSNNVDNRGVGGPGGAVHAWSETNIFGTLRAISTAGGSGAPPGVDGAQLQDSGPTGLAVDPTGLLSFTSQSPNAEGYRIIQTLGDAATPVLTTRSTSRIVVPPVALCTPVSYQVQAYQSIVGWTSPLTPAVPFLRQPSATQRCTDAPALTRSSNVIVKLNSLTKAKGALSFVVETNGVGNVTATATAKGAKKPLGVSTIPLAKPGAFKVTVKLDLKVKLQYTQGTKKEGAKKTPSAVARIAVKLVAAAPTGKATTSITVPVEVRK